MRRNSATETMQEQDFWTVLEKVYSLQVPFSQDVHFGAIRCSVHGYHVQAQEACVAFAYAARERKEYGEAAIHGMNWLCARQEPAGYWGDASERLKGTIHAAFVLMLVYGVVHDTMRFLDKKGCEESIRISMQWIVKQPVQDFKTLAPLEQLTACFLMRYYAHIWNENISRMAPVCGDLFRKTMNEPLHIETWAECAAMLIKVYDTEKYMRDKADSCILYETQALLRYAFKALYGACS